MKWRTFLKKKINKKAILLKKNFFFENNLQLSEEINDQAYKSHEDVTKNSINFILNRKIKYRFT